MFLQEAAPAISPWLRPEFLIVAAPVVITTIAWFVRGEFQTRANATRQREYEAAMDERVEKVESNVDRVKAAHYAHAGDTEKHHNAEAFREFREALNQRFSTIDTKLSDIKSMIANGNK